VPASSRAGFLFFSRLYEGKRPHVLLDLARHLPKQKFTIAGAPAMANDPYVSALAASTRFQTPGNVRLTLDPSDSEISRLFAEHEFFVFPSRWEQFGIVTVEALQAGLLPLVHDSGGQREIVPIAALRFKSDMELAEKAAVLLATPPSERKDMLEALRRHVARGSPENFQREMILPMCQDLGLTHLMSQV
jgi:glycosyltransferase involved in cell wall biosynthesis